MYISKLGYSFGEMNEIMKTIIHFYDKRSADKLEGFVREKNYSRPFFSIGASSTLFRVRFFPWKTTEKLEVCSAQLCYVGANNVLVKALSDVDPELKFISCEFQVAPKTNPSLHVLSAFCFELVK